MISATDELTKKYTEYQQEQANLPKNIQERRHKELQELQEKGMQFQQVARFISSSYCFCMAWMSVWAFVNSGMTVSTSADLICPNF